MSRFINLMLLIACLTGAAISITPAYAAEPVRIGILAFRPKPQTLMQWQPLAVALKQAIPERDFVVEAFTLAELELAVANKQLDFVLTNPGHYLLLTRRYGLSSPLATLAATDSEPAISVFGGVIFTRAGTANIDTLQDVKHKTVAVTNTESMGGYMAQAYELSLADIHLPQDIKLLNTGMPHDNVVDAVLAGHADVGFVRSGVLEDLVNEGKLNIEQINILNRQNPPNFPQQVSTRLYPEWPFASLTHVDENLARHVAAALFLLEENTTATRKMGIHGFVVPADYTPVEDLLRQLRLPPYEGAPQFTLKDVSARYQWQIIGSLFVVGFILLLIFRLWVTNRKLWAEQQKVKQQTQQLQESEHKLTVILENVEACIYLKDRQGRYLYANRQVRKLFAASMNEIVGQRDERFFDDKTAEKLHLNDRLVLEDGLTLRTEETNRNTHDNHTSTYLSIKLPLRNGAGEIYALCGISTDITETKKTEKYEHFRSQTLELLTGNTPLPQILEAIVLGVEHLNPEMLCSILLLDIEGKHLGNGAAPSLPDFYNEAINGVEIGLGVGSCGTAAFTGQRVIVEDISSHPYWAPYKELATRAGLSACWSQPILSAVGKVLGTFAIYHRDARPPSEDDIFIIEQTARLASLAIDRKHSENKLRTSELALKSVSQGVLITTPDQNILWVNDAFLSITGYSKADIMGQNCRFMQGPATDLQTLEELRIALEQGLEFSAEILNYRQDGSSFWNDLTISPTHDEQGQLTHFVGVTRDITERKEAEEKLHLAASVFTHAREGIMITAPDGTIIDVNDAFCRITGYKRSDVIGGNPHLLSSGHHGKEFYVSLWHDLTEKDHWYGEVWNRRKNGEVYAAMQTISAVTDTHGHTRHYVALFSDITTLKEHEKELEHIAHYDALTSLPNRVLLADRLHQSMAQAQRHSQPLAVAYLDLDGFKAINDNYGHEAGDQLLIAATANMKHALREGDTLARLGGDEFVAVLLNLPDIEASVPVLLRLLAAAAEPVHVGDLTLQVSASLGVTFYPQHEDIDADQLLRQADQAMYVAKQAGKNRYHVFDAVQDSSIRGHHESLGHIRDALTKREFVLYYQPKVNMRTGTVIGAEALIRWQHPEKGLLPPIVFLPVIEDHPLAVELGEWVIDAALTQMEIWHAEGLNIPVSVNISARQLQQSDFVECLRAILAKHPDILPSSLELEVLETSALEDMGKVSRIIHDCREIGVKFALDDFGTGYSSLTYLKHLPVTLLKIDQSFVRDMLDDPDDLAIVEGVLGLASAFRRDVIAEGVETLAHGELLLQLGCVLAQGYGIARPMPADQLPHWTANWRPDPAWIDLPSVNRNDIPLLFASVEHRAWITAITAYVTGERELPQLFDHRACRFTAWLEGGDNRLRHAELPAFQTIEPLHRQLHFIADELIDLQVQGHNSEALTRLDELQALGDALLFQMKIMVQEIKK
ncbi:MAG: EAL domain-containing protein [Methylococcaceae bacterium]|nr:EAL domain-containing protein [Methylococcaceae bacterium]MDP2393801.1 EAL domain-containing protein [Methylococcaceae bacterium]MDP3019827.1 EAL domain-containing protein [Methylococcaceae bacterium]MDP3389568.1 EAL domain-containing protein [Methylococcaceae bacterium]MDZ4156223.1 EAL domain-containing protein [Methylococcales bacterium]